MNRKHLVFGWVAFGLSLLVALVWAWWGTLEAFHEGWWASTLLGRLGQTLFYLTPMWICIAFTALAVRWPRIGAVVFFAVGLYANWFILKPRWDVMTIGMFLSWLPFTGLLVGVGFLWWFGKIKPLRLAYGLLIGLPLVTFICVGAFPAWKVSTRHTDVKLEAQLVEGNEVALVWAPAGPGWVRDAKSACNWHEAMERVALLSEDGTTFMAEPQHIWRLPTTDEAIRSMARHGVNSGGSWDPENKATFEVMPDKEPPLWDPFAETIYWWTATEDGEDNAWIVVYDGGSWSKPKKNRMGSRGFRAVKDPAAVTDAAPLAMEAAEPQLEQAEVSPAEPTDRNE